MQALQNICVRHVSNRISWTVFCSTLALAPSILFILCGFFLSLSSTAAADPDPFLTAKQLDQSLNRERTPIDTSQDEYSDLCDDETFLRRITLDLAGRQPTTEEISTFSQEDSKTKRALVIDRLLESPEWAETWARYFRDVILYRRTDERTLFMSGPLEKFFFVHLDGAARWDAIARAVITASGNPLEHGETAIVMGQMGETADIAAEISRIFLGIQIQCAQCHDHRTDRWKRSQFHEMAAFFPRIEIRPSPGNGINRFVVVSRDFDAGRGGKALDNPRRGHLEHEMPDLQDPSQPGTVMTPVFFLTGATVPKGTRDRERREAIAAAVIDPLHPWFVRSIVNRLWSELLGEGFYNPVDDMGPDRTSSAPQSLELLTSGLIASHYDLRWLFRTITLTETYQRVSQSRGSTDHKGFAINCPQRLRADQLFNQILSTLGADESRYVRRQGNGNGAGQSMASPRAMFATVFGYDPSQPREDVAGTIPQSPFAHE